MLESKIQKNIRLSLAEDPNITHWRNNTAKGWSGKSVKITPFNYKTTRLFPGDVVVRDARVLISGLCEGSSDLIGFKQVTITPEMVGTTIAQFLAVEVKAERGRLTKQQKNFNLVINSAGGIGIVARSTDDLEVLKK